MESMLSVLGLTNPSSWAEVHVAYRQAIKLWHPDRFANNPEMLPVAEEKTRQINYAFSYLKEHFQPNQSFSSSASKTYAGKSYAQEDFVPFDTYGPFSRRNAFISGLRQAFSVLLVVFCATYLVATVGYCSWSGIEAALQAKLKELEMAAKPSETFELPTTTRYRVIAPRGFVDKAGQTRLVGLAENLDQFYMQRKADASGLIASATSCNAELAQKLLSQGTDINQTDRNGETALSWAARFNCVPVAKLLLVNGARTDTRAYNGFTPYRWAVWSKSSEVQSLLSRAGA